MTNTTKNHVVIGPPIVTVAKVTAKVRHEQCEQRHSYRRDRWVLRAAGPNMLATH